MWTQKKQTVKQTHRWTEEEEEEEDREMTGLMDRQTERGNRETTGLMDRQTETDKNRQINRDTDNTNSNRHPTI